VWPPDSLIAPSSSVGITGFCRSEQQSPQFKNRLQQRNAIKGTISELARAHGLRRSRYRAG
jgi:hypothetical protein